MSNKKTQEALEKAQRSTKSDRGQKLSKALAFSMKASQLKKNPLSWSSSTSNGPRRTTRRKGSNKTINLLFKSCVKFKKNIN